MVKKKLAMLVVAVAVICGLVVVGPAGRPTALAKEEEDLLLEAIGEIASELQEVNSTLKDIASGPEEPEPIEWIGQTIGVPGNLDFELLQMMCDDIFTASSGRLILDLHPGMDLCPAPQEFDAVDEGDIDFAVNAPNYWVESFPAAGLFGTRCGGMSPTEKYLWFISGGGAELAQEMVADTNVYIVPGGGHLSSPQPFLYSNAEIGETADLADLLVRSFGDGGDILTRMDVTLVFLPIAELYEAMQRGIIHACSFNTPCMDAMLKLQEVSHWVYISACRAPHGFSPFLVNEERWNELPDDLKVLVEKLTREEAIEFYAEVCQCDMAALEAFPGDGCAVAELPEDVESDFLAEAEAYYDEKALADPFYDEVLDSQREFQESFREVWARP